MAKTLSLILHFALVAFTAQVALAAPAEDAEMRILPSTGEGDGCSLSTHGFESKAVFLKFFNELKTAAAKRDPKAMKPFVVYPLSYSTKAKKTQIKNAAALDKRLANLFPAKVLEAIEKQDPGDMLCNSQGAMIGNGEVWIQQRDGKIGIATVNL